MVQGLLTSRALRCLAAASLLACAAPSPGREVVSREAARESALQPRIQDASARIEALAQQRDANALVSELERLLASTSGDDLATEQLLDGGLHALARLTPTPSAREWVQAQTQRSPQVFVRVDPAHGERIAPLYDAGATARFVLQTWTRTAARSAALEQLAAGSTQPLTRFARNGRHAETDPEQAGVVDAFRRAPPAQLVVQREALLDQMQAHPIVAELALVAGERLADAALLRAVLLQGPSPTALAAAPIARRTLNVDAAREALVAASERKDIASAAVLELGLLARSDVASREPLYEFLGESTRGPSAAAALASAHDSAVISELGARLLASSDERSRRHLALALKLEGSDASKAQMQRFVQARVGSAKLQRDVRQWLAN